MIIENYDIGAVKRRYIDDPLIPAWLMINGSDDRYQILAATGLNIDPILVVAQTLNIGIYWLKTSYIVNFG